MDRRSEVLRKRIRKWNNDMKRVMVKYRVKANRCEELPVATDLHEVGSFNIFND